MCHLNREGGKEGGGGRERGGQSSKHNLTQDDNMARTCLFSNMVTPVGETVARRAQGPWARVT